MLVLHTLTDASKMRSCTAAAAAVVWRIEVLLRNACSGTERHPAEGNERFAITIYYSKLLHETEPGRGRDARSVYVLYFRQNSGSQCIACCIGQASYLLPKLEIPGGGGGGRPINIKTITSFKSTIRYTGIPIFHIGLRAYVFCWPAFTKWPALHRSGTGSCCSSSINCICIHVIV